MTLKSESGRELRIGGLYRHYKNKLYRVHGTARHSETLELLVVYEALYQNELGAMWVRPFEMFLGDTEVGGKLIPRFADVLDENNTTT